MNRKLIIALGAALTIIVVATGTYAKTYATSPQIIDISIAEKNSAKFIDLVGNEFNELNYSKIFSSNRYDENAKWKQKRWVLENDVLKVETDESGSPITFMDKRKMVADSDTIKNRNEKIKSNKQLNDALFKHAVKLADNLQVDNKVYIGSGTTSDGFIVFTWKRTINNIMFSNDFIQIIVDPTDSKIASISKRWATSIPDNINKTYINVDAATDVATKYLNKNSKTIKNFISSQLEIVLPDNDVSKPKVVYSVKFNTNTSVEDSVWVDATTGIIVGESEVLAVTVN